MYDSNLDSGVHTPSLEEFGRTLTSSAEPEIITKNQRNGMEFLEDEPFEKIRGRCRRQLFVEVQLQYEVSSVCSQQSDFLC